MTTLTPNEKAVIDSIVELCMLAGNGKDFEVVLQEITGTILVAIQKHTYDELKPQALIGDQYVIRDSVGGFVYDTCKTNQEHECWHCGDKTVWFDIDFGAYLCSLECSRAKWTEYSETARKGSAGDDKN